MLGNALVATFSRIDWKATSSLIPRRAVLHNWRLVCAQPWFGVPHCAHNQVVACSTPVEPRTTPAHMQCVYAASLTHITTPRPLRQYSALPLLGSQLAPPSPHCDVFESLGRNTWVPYAPAIKSRHTGLLCAHSQVQTHWRAALISALFMQIKLGALQWPLKLL